ESNECAPFQSQRSKDSAVWLFFQSLKEQCSSQVNPHAAIQSAVGSGKGGGLGGLAGIQHLFPDSGF
ncbi:hypothetical protein FQN60_000248, partial [Etheostoma spectabile]